MAAPPAVTISYTSIPGFPTFCDVTVNLSHFTPLTNYSVNVEDERNEMYGPIPRHHRQLGCRVGVPTEFHDWVMRRIYQADEDDRRITRVRMDGQR